MINTAINARDGAASQTHREIQTPAVPAKAFSVLDGVCLFAGSIIQEKQQVGDLASSFWCPLKIKLEKANRSRRTSSSSQLPGLGDPGLELPEHLSRPAALSAWSSWKEEWDDVSAAEPTSNTLSLAAVRAWGRAQAQSWMEMPLNVHLNLFLCWG